MKPVKKSEIYLFFLPVLLFCFCKCKSDFSTNSAEEPFPVIYGLLDIANKEHYAKIFKSFLVEGNAYDTAKNIDKYSYIDSIDVYLNEYDIQNKLIRKIPMDTTTIFPKDSGLFFYPTQILYVANAILNNNYLYEIEVFNPYTKNIAKTKIPVALPHGIVINKPTGNEITILDDVLDFVFHTGKNTTIHQLYLKYYYTEIFIDGTRRQAPPIVWELGYFVDKSMATNMQKTTPLSGAFFFRKIAENVQENTDVKGRYTDSIMLEIHTAGKDWGLYLLSNMPYTGINQEKLYHSNIIAYNTETGKEKYATGFFSSRGITYKKFTDLTLAFGSRDSLFRGRYTKHLGFTDVY